MSFVKSLKYNIIGDYKIEPVEKNCIFYLFTQKNKVVYVPECDIREIDGFSPEDYSKGIHQANVRSYKYNLNGIHHITKSNEFYQFTKENKMDKDVVYIPKWDINEVDGMTINSLKTNQNNGQMIPMSYSNQGGKRKTRIRKGSRRYMSRRNESVHLNR